jgi:sulfite exporter TauE/SafE
MLDAFLAVAGVGFAIGLRHAFEPDHLAAVSALATRQPGLGEGARLGVAWGVGHTATVAAVALVVTATGLHLPQEFSAGAELLVAALLILLGLSVIARYARGRWHMHAHAHGGTAHLHLHSHATDTSHVHAHPSWDARRSFGLGLAHGLAGSGALVLILVAAAPTAALRISYLVAFGLGSTAGMLAVSLALSATARWAARGSARLATALHVGAATASVLAGMLLAGRTVRAWWA